MIHSFKCVSYMCWEFSNQKQGCFLSAKELIERFNFSVEGIVQIEEEGGD